MEKNRNDNRIKIIVKSDDNYCGGFGAGHHVYPSHHSCAWACACTGGGRAGCSAKEIYGAKVQTSELYKARHLD